MLQGAMTADDKPFSTPGRVTSHKTELSRHCTRRNVRVAALRDRDGRRARDDDVTRQWEIIPRRGGARATRKEGTFTDTKERKRTRCGRVTNIGFTFPMQGGGLPRDLPGELSVDASPIPIRALKTRRSLHCEIRRDELADEEERGRERDKEGELSDTTRRCYMVHYDIGSRSNPIERRLHLDYLR